MTARYKANRTTVFNCLKYDLGGIIAMCHDWPVKLFTEFSTPKSPNWNRNTHKTHTLRNKQSSGASGSAVRRSKVRRIVVLPDAPYRLLAFGLRARPENPCALVSDFSVFRVRDASDCLGLESVVQCASRRRALPRYW